MAPQGAGSQTNVSCNELVAKEARSWSECCVCDPVNGGGGCERTLSRAMTSGWSSSWRVVGSTHSVMSHRSRFLRPKSSEGATHGLSKWMLHRACAAPPAAEAPAVPSPESPAPRADLAGEGAPAAAAAAVPAADAGVPTREPAALVVPPAPAPAPAPAPPLATCPGLAAAAAPSIRFLTTVATVLNSASPTR